MSDTIDQRTVSLARAAVLAAAVAEATRRDLAMCLAVTGAADDSQGVVRMDRGPLRSSGIAIDKAYTVSAFGLPTHAWWDVIKTTPP